jgi:hypothetical protein
MLCIVAAEDGSDATASSARTTARLMKSPAVPLLLLTIWARRQMASRCAIMVTGHAVEPCYAWPT